MDWNRCLRPEVEPLVAYRPGLRASQVRAMCEVDRICKLSSNESPHGPFPLALEGMSQVLEYANLYPDGASTALKEALSARYDVPLDQIVVGAGSNELLLLLGQVMLQPGDEVVYGWPSFIVYPTVAQIAGARAVAVPLKDDTYDLDAIAAAITDRTKIVFLCNPNNPTGTIYTRGDFERFLASVPDHVVVVVDEAYIEFVDDPVFPDALDYYDGKRPIVILRTFSKIYSLAGVRCGYGFAPVELAEAIDKVRAPFNVSTVAQVGAYHSLKDTDELKRRHDENARERALLQSALDTLEIPHAVSQTNFVWAYVKDSKAAFDALLKEGVIVRDFGGGGALRVGVGSPYDTETTVAAFAKLRDEGVI